MFSKGFTLTEILIAIVLMGLVILTVTSVDITSRYFFKSISGESRIYDEAKIAMEHMVKNFTQAHEIYDFLGTDSWTIGVRIDTNKTPANFGDDTWVIYCFVGAAGEIWHYPDAGSNGLPPEPPTVWDTWGETQHEVIAAHIVIDPEIPMFTVGNNRIDIDIIAEDEGLSVNLKSSVVLRSMSAT